MASPLSNALRLIRPGEMVVPVTEILEKLGDRLTTEEKERLLVAILSRRTDRVLPGDLITSDLLNQILADLTDLETRLARVESKQPSTDTAVRIDRILPSDDLTVGDEIAIEGRNFEFGLGATYVAFGKKSIFAFKPGSREGRVVVDVPDPGTLPKEGASMPLTVANRTSTDSKNVTLRPAVAPLYGNVRVVPETIDPNPPKSAEDTFFAYTITSAASQEATFSISVSLAASGEDLSDTKYDHLVTILDKDKKALTNGELTLEQNATALVYIRVAKLPFTGEFSILVTARAPGITGGESGIKNYQVGAEDLSDEFLTLETPSYTPTNAVTAGTLTAKPGTSVKASMSLKLSEKAIAAGVTSANCDLELSLTDGSGWTLVFRDPTPDTGSLASASNVSLTKDSGRTVEIAVQAKPNPSQTGHMTLTVTRRGQSGLVTKVKVFGLKLQAVP